MPVAFDVVRTKASCAAAARCAQDVIADFGEVAANVSGGLRKLAESSSKNAERNCHSLFSQLKLKMPLDVSFLKTESDLRVPYISVRTWLQMLTDQNCTHLAAGLRRPDGAREAAIFQEFWKRFAENHSEHPVFERAKAGFVTLDKCIPLLCHGDEGRSKKRQPFLVVNVHSALGRGIEPGLKTATHRPYKKLLCNFVGHSYTTRFLLAALPKEDYTGPRAWVFDLLLSTLASDLKFVSDTGVTNSRGSRYWGICIGICGDWPFLVKAGGLTRSFMNAPKHKEQGDANDGLRECRGVCHLCDAGRPGVLFEEIATTNPAWAATELRTSPFGPNGCHWEVVPHEPNALAKLFKYDLFHVVHLGVARSFLGSALVMLSFLEDGPSVEVRFNQLTMRYLDWCRQHRCPAHTQKITKDHLGWANQKCYPTGGWHKGALSTQLMNWTEWRFLNEAENENWANKDPMLPLMGEAAVALNTFVRRLYGSPAFLCQADALLIGNYGMRFLRRYNTLARMAFSNRRQLWAIQPKFHAFAHLVMSLFIESKFTENILMYSVQMDEDFLGKPSRLSRKVSEKLCSERVTIRYMEACYSEWVKCGYFIRAQGR